MDDLLLTHHGHALLQGVQAQGGGGKFPEGILVLELVQELEGFVEILRQIAGHAGDLQALAGDVAGGESGLGGEGGRDLAREVVRLCDQPRLEEFTFAYPDNTSLIYKLNSIVGRVYGGSQAVLTPAAQKQAQQLFDLGFGDLPVCMAKTQYSLSDDPTLLGAPEGFTVTVRSVTVSAGAGFLVALTGDVLTMPGLPKIPAAENIDVDDDGRITGLF